MTEYAELDKDGKVLRVIVCETKEWCEQRLGGEWVERKQPAGIGYTYDKVKATFDPPKREAQPAPEMTANGTLPGDVRL